MKTNINYQFILNIVLLIILFFLIRDCSDRKPIIGKNTVIEKTRTDTFIKRDTNWVLVNSLIHTNDSLQVVIRGSDKRYKELQTKIKDYIEPKLPNESDRNRAIFYETDVSDTYISGKILSALDTTNCNLLHQYLEYTFKSPIFTEQVTIKETKEITIDNTKHRRYGIGVEGNNKLEFGGKLIYQDKNFQYQLGAKRQNINGTKDAVLEFGIIKLF